MFSVKSASVQWIPLIYLIPTFQLMAVNQKKPTIGYAQLILFNCLMVNNNNTLSVSDITRQHSYCYVSYFTPAPSICNILTRNKSVQFLGPRSSSKKQPLQRMGLHSLKASSSIWSTYEFDTMDTWKIKLAVGCLFKTPLHSIASLHCSWISVEAV
jgi:hypothetical protein